MNWMERSFVLALVVMMVSVVFAPAYSGVEHTVRVLLMKDALHMTDASVEEDYGTFAIASIHEPDATALASAGYILGTLPNEQKRVEMLPGVNDYEVVFKGPVKASWLHALEATGAEITPMISPSSKYGYVVVASEDVARAIASIPSVASLFPYAQKLQGELPSSGAAKVVITFFPGYHEELGNVLQRYDDAKWGGYVITDVNAGMLGTIAREPGVASIEPYYPVKIISDRPSNGPLNDVSRWVIQSYIPGNTSIWDHGIHGEGIVVGCSDTGVDYDHMNFRDTMSDMGVPGPNHRKVVKLTYYANDQEESMAHGSHVVGTILGKNISDPNNYVQYDGMAYNAKVSFMDIFNISKTQDEIMPPMKEMLDDMYSAGARSHSGSWGGYSNQSEGAYSWRSLGADQYMWDHPDFLGIWSAGNSGPDIGTVGEPGTAKNIVTAGASYNGITKDIADFSSNGPTKDGVRKPTVVAPGVSIMSVDGDPILGNYNSDYRSMSGTSMSAPTMAGGTALVEQYFRDGFYPTGKKNQSNGFMPSGALRKAILINSAWDQFGGFSVDSNIPDDSQGWGKIKLDDALFFDGDARKLWIDDAAYSKGLNTSEKAEYLVNVSAGQPFKVSLVYNDFPGKGLINDLDLRVIAPDSTIYLGNVFNKGQSVPGGKPDKYNNDEQVLVASPTQEQWLVQVIGTNVPKGPQPYSFVVTGNLTGASKSSGPSGPDVLSTNPKNLAGAVPISTSISLTFDRQMNTSTAESAYSISPTVNGTFSWSSNTMTLKPDAMLGYNTTYAVTEAKGAADTNGYKMSFDYKFTFRTVALIPLMVVGTMPSDGEQGVNASSAIKVVFNRDVLSSSAESAFSIAPSVSGQFSWPDNSTMLFTPGSKLQGTTNYSAKVAKTAQDRNGISMKGDYAFWFATEFVPDTTPPKVKITQPSNGAVVSGKVDVKADATDDHGVAKVDFYLDGKKVSTGTSPPFVWTWDTAASANGTHKIKAQAFDGSDNSASDEISVNVANDLTPPTVTGTEPKDQSTGVALDAKISITFSEEMDHLSVQSAFSISPNVTGNFTWNGSTMTFTPNSELMPGTTYFVKVEKSARDAHGNALANVYSFSFITKERGSSINGDAIVYLISILAILAIVVVLFLLIKRKRPEEKESPPPEDEEPKKEESFKRPKKEEKGEGSEKEKAEDEGSSKKTEGERKQTTNGKAKGRGL